MPVESSAIVQRLWNYCHVLRDDGVSYGDYVEQLTYLLFLKLAHEQAGSPYKPAMIPAGCDWPSLLGKDGDELARHYGHVLEALGEKSGALGVIFGKARNKIQDPAKLRRLITLMDGETWVGLDLDVPGEIYQGLLQKNAEDVKSGAGQYFTPRALIQAIVEVMQPAPGATLCDPACGTGGFFLAAHDYVSRHHTLDPDQRRFLRDGTFNFKGWEIVEDTARLCVMNLYLHGIGGDENPVVVGDSLTADPGQRFDLVLTNPPFGRKSSVTIVNGADEAAKSALAYRRGDFWAATSNKQLNFLQHVKTLLKTHGRAAIVVPDNVLFEGGAGEVVRRALLRECDVHTLLRLPPGVFYAPGVKANVLFFDRQPTRAKPWTERLWVYDLRTNKRFTLKRHPLRYADLEDFITCYHPENRPARRETERFRAFDYAELVQREQANLDILWLEDANLEGAENLPAPDVLAGQIVENLQVALEQFRGIYKELEKRSGR